MEKIKGLDTLRAFAVFFVIITHFGVWFDDTSFSGRLIRHVIVPDGAFGVILFFVLSGFLITSILLKDRDSGGNKVLLVRDFFIRRALRIFPIYYLTVAVLFLVNYPDVRNYIWYNLTYTHNFLCFRTNTWDAFSHTWTLCIEEQFYLLWPWLIVYSRERYLKPIIWSATMVGVFSTIWNMGVNNHVGPFMVFNCFDAFGIGGSYAWVRHSGRERNQFKNWLNVAALGALAVYCYWKLADFNGYPHYGLFMLKTVDSVLALWLIVAVVNNKSARAEKYLLGNRVLNYIGKISYGIYLYHYVYIQGYCAKVNQFFYEQTLQYPTLNKIVHDHHVDYWIQVSIMILMAAVSYQFIEKPFLRLKQRFRYSGGTAASQLKPVTEAVS